MDHAAQVATLKRLLAYVDGKTTALAPAPWENDVSSFISPETLKRETETLFRRTPVMVGLSCDWPKPGTFGTDDFAGVPMLITRDRDGTLGAFLNVCRHRGAKVANGSGTASVFSCPYHAWTYSLDGGIRGIPDEGAFPGVRAERRGLTPLPICERYGLVWVMPPPAADLSRHFDIDPWLGGLGPELATWGIDRYHAYDKRTVNETMNWKLLVDTFHEGYHIGFLHRDSLTGILHGNVADFEAFGPHHRLAFPRTKLERLKSKPEAEWDLMWNTALIYALFPNTLLVLQGDHIETHRIFPAEDRVDRAVMETSLYTPNPVASDEEKQHWDANLNLVLKVVLTEDFPVGRSMQIGFGSGAQSQLVYGRNEPAMIHFHQSLRRALGLDVHNEPGQVRAAE